MYEKILIVLLLSGFVSMQTTIPTQPSTKLSTNTGISTPGGRSLITPAASTTQDEAIPREEGNPELVTEFSLAVIVVIVLAVMAGLIGIILLTVYGVRWLRKKSTSSSLQGTDTESSAVKTENLENSAEDKSPAAQISE